LYSCVSRYFVQSENVQAALDVWETKRARDSSDSERFINSPEQMAFAFWP